MSARIGEPTNHLLELRIRELKAIPLRRGAVVAICRARLCRNGHHDALPMNTTSPFSHPAPASRRDVRSTIHTEPCCHAALRAPPGHHGLLKACAVCDVALVLLMPPGVRSASLRNPTFRPKARPLRLGGHMQRSTVVLVDPRRGTLPRVVPCSWCIVSVSHVFSYHLLSMELYRSRYHHTCE